MKNAAKTAAPRKAAAAEVRVATGTGVTTAQNVPEAGAVAVIEAWLVRSGTTAGAHPVPTVAGAGTSPHADDDRVPEVVVGDLVLEVVVGDRVLEVVVGGLVPEVVGGGLVLKATIDAAVGPRRTTVIGAAKVGASRKDANSDKTRRVKLG